MHTKDRCNYNTHKAFPVFASQCFVVVLPSSGIPNCPWPQLPASNISLLSHDCNSELSLNHWCGQLVFVSGTYLGPMTKFYLYAFFRDDYFPAVLAVCPLWREDGSATCSAIGDWSGSRRTHNHTLLSHLRLLCSLFVFLYGSQELCWRYSNPPLNCSNTGPSTDHTENVSSVIACFLLLGKECVDRAVC
jgi:hypothetical protein